MKILKILKFLEALKIMKIDKKAKRPKKNNNTPTHPMTMPQAAGKKTWVPGPHLFGMQKNQNIDILSILLDSQQSRQWLWILLLLLKPFFKRFKFGETITFISYINDIGYAKPYFLKKHLPTLLSLMNYNSV